jgi:hypothetical protein
MASVIDQLINKRDEEIRLAKEAKEAERKEAQTKRFDELKAYLGEFWTMLEKRAEETGEKYPFSVQWEKDSPTLFLEIPALHDHKLAPIVIKWGPHALTPNYYDYNEVFKISGSYCRKLEEALRAARESYPKYVEHIRSERIELFEKALRYGHNGKKVESEARDLSVKYASEFPDREAEAGDLLIEWLRLRDQETQEAETRRRTEEYREAKRVLENTLRLGYISDLAQWLEVRDAIEASNKEIAEEIQRVADLREYREYKLTYAIVARYDGEEGEGETEVETRSVYTLQSEADPAGYWMVDGKLTRYYHLVSLEALDVHASNSRLAQKVTKAGIDFYFDPFVLEDKIPEILADIQELPDEPTHPAELGYLDSRTKRNYIDQARALLSGEGEPEETEVPF